MDALSPDRLMTIAIFLAALIFALAFVRVNRTRLSEGLRKGKRLEVAEVTTIGADTRATLLHVDGSRVLVISSKRSGVAVHELPQVTVEDEPRSEGDA